MLPVNSLEFLLQSLKSTFLIFFNSIYSANVSNPISCARKAKLKISNYASKNKRLVFAQMASSSRQILLLMKKFENLDVPSVVPNVDQAGTVYEFGIKRRNRTTAKEQTNLF